jgi:aryl-alcohol dehydrogenase-like predicted oxidoreductase
LRNPAVTAAIVGARRPEQVVQMAGAGEIQLSRSDLEEIASVAQSAA